MPALRIRLQPAIVLVLALAMLLSLTGLGQASTGVVITRGQAQCRQVALTFDAGAADTSTVKILQVLEKHNARSTFFLTGQFVRKYPGHTQAIAAFGHEISNHSDTHPDFRTLSVDAMRQQLRTTEATMLAAVGVSTKPYWRPPYGAYNSQIVQVAAEEGYPWTLMWDIDTIDWQHPPVQTILDRVLNRVQPGSNVLMHMGGNTTGDALAQLIPALEQRGYMMVTIGELLGHTRAGADFGGRHVHVQSGDTLHSIATCFNTTAEVLAAANGIASPAALTAGTRLYVPFAHEVPDPGQSGGGPQPGTEEPVQEPVGGEPSSEEPAEEEPGDTEPGDEVPGHEEPADEEPADEEPAAGEPADQAPAAENPAGDGGGEGIAGMVAALRNASDELAWLLVGLVVLGAAWWLRLTRLKARQAASKRRAGPRPAPRHGRAARP